MARAVVVALAAAVLAGGASAQYPDKPIRFVVPQAPGSATDTVSRILAPEMSKSLGQQVVVDNRPGGALTIGIDIVAKAPPDGYTIGMGPIGAMAITRHMVAKLPYNIERDLQPVAVVSKGHLLLAVSPSLPVGSVQELIVVREAEPGEAPERVLEQRVAGPCRRRALQVHDRDRDRARALQGRRDGDQRPDRGPRPGDVGEPELDLAARALGQGEGARGERRAPLAGISRAADDRRSGRGGLRGRAPGPVSSRRRGSRGRCSTS